MGNGASMKVFSVVKSYEFVYPRRQTLVTHIGSVRTGGTLGRPVVAIRGDGPEGGHSAVSLRLDPKLWRKRVVFLLKILSRNGNEAQWRIYIIHIQYILTFSLFQFVPSRTMADPQQPCAPIEVRSYHLFR